MSVHGLASASDDKIAPASSFTKASTLATDDNPRPISLFSCLFEVLTTTSKTENYERAQLEMEKAHPQPDHPEPKVEKADTAVGDNNGQATDTLNTSSNGAEYARNNWRELRARVESVDPRVFAYQKDPKYLQQCEEAKQRRALAAATSVSPSWH